MIYLLVFILGIALGAITNDRLWRRRLHLSPAKGQALDRLAMDRGFQRKKGESDRAFRKRITEELRRHK
jgi:hypothetical protein